MKKKTTPPVATPQKSAITLNMNCERCQNPFTVIVRLPNIRFPKGELEDAGSLKIGNEMDAELGRKSKRLPFYRELGTLTEQGLQSANANNPVELQLDMHPTSDMEALVETVKHIIEKHITPGHTLIVIWVDETKPKTSWTPPGHKPKGFSMSKR
jgi:hypothetical protein